MLSLHKSSGTVFSSSILSISSVKLAKCEFATKLDASILVTSPHNLSPFFFITFSILGSI